MKHSISNILFCSLLFAACNTNQETETKSTDTAELKKEFKADAERQIVKNLTQAGAIVKAESPDAEAKFEQGYALPRMNDGTAQSPVNILTSGLEFDNRPQGHMKFTGYINAVENLGHTIQVDFTNGSVTLAGGESYELKQLHFHTPSEHLIDGITYPMEMHIVSKLNDSIKNGNATYTVMGILFKMGRENKFLKMFLSLIPKEEGKDSLDPAKVKLEDLFADVSGLKGLKEYKYQGSLTTPPYTESVNWVISTKIFEASEEQITTIERLEGNNARHIRALNKRRIEIY